jgi:integral membrane protein
VILKAGIISIFACESFSNIMFDTPLSRFRLVAFLEGCSFLLIGITMILKYKYAMPGPNYVVGMAHGFLFILYVGMLLHVAYVYKWSFMKVALGFLASLVPFGTFYADKKLFKNQ